MLYFPNLTQNVLQWSTHASPLSYLDGRYYNIMRGLENLVFLELKKATMIFLAKNTQ